MWLAWLLAAWLLASAAAFDFGELDFNCGHVPPAASSVISQVPVASAVAAGTPPLPEEWKPIRIHVHYDSSIDALSEADAAIVKHATELAVNVWSGRLKVRRLTEPLRLARKCDYGWPLKGRMMCYGDCDKENKCIDFNIPEQHLRPCEHCDRRNGGASDLASCKVNDLPWNEKNLKDELEKTTGIPNADFVLYVFAEPCTKKLTVANAGHCQMEATFDRPIAGRAKVCTPLQDNYDKHKYGAVMTHELTHALAFSTSLYPYFRKDDGSPYIKRDENGRPTGDSLNPVVMRETRGDWWTAKGNVNRTSFLISTPRVARESRAHFGCDTLQGMALENEGDSGSGGSHWEKRLLRNELMTASITRLQSHPISRVTLALMEDSGWYRADWKSADLLHWGRNLGCKFAEKSCGEWIKDRRAAGKHPAPFCDQEDLRKLSEKPVSYFRQRRCSADRESIGYCDLMDLRKFENVKQPTYQYFEHIDGVNDTDVVNYRPTHRNYMDDCPYVYETSPKLCIFASEANVEYLQEYGSSSLCIDFASTWKKNAVAIQPTQLNGLHGGCYKVTCYSDTLYITVAGTAHKCLKSDEGKKIAIEATKDGTSYSGALFCPAYGEVCPKDKYDKDPATTTTRTTTLATTTTTETANKTATLPPAAQQSPQPTKTGALFQLSLSFIVAVLKLF